MLFELATEAPDRKSLVGGDGWRSSFHTNNRQFSMLCNIGHENDFSELNTNEFRMLLLFVYYATGGK